MDYLKSKVVEAESPSSEESEDEAVNCEEGSEAEEEGSCTPAAQQDREAARAEVRVHRGELGSLGREEVCLTLVHVPCSPFVGACNVGERQLSGPETCLQVSVLLLACCVTLGKHLPSLNLFPVADAEAACPS